MVACSHGLMSACTQCSSALTALSLRWIGWNCSQTPSCVLSRWTAQTTCPYYCAWMLFPGRASAFGSSPSGQSCLGSLTSSPRHGNRPCFMQTCSVLWTTNSRTSRALKSWSMHNIGSVCLQLAIAREVILRLDCAQDQRSLSTEERAL